MDNKFTILLMKCKLCDKTFDISIIGEAAVHSHGNGYIDFVVKLQSQPTLPALMSVERLPGSQAASVDSQKSSLKMSWNFIP